MADSCLGGLVVMMLAWNVREWGSIPCWGTEFFGLSEPTVTFGTQLWDSLIYLYGQSVRTCFPQRGVNVMADSCLGGLAVMMLTRNARDPGLIPHWGTELFGLSEPTVTPMKNWSFFLLSGCGMQEIAWTLSELGLQPSVVYVSPPHYTILQLCDNLTHDI